MATHDPHFDQWAALISDPSKIVPSVFPDGSPNFGAFQMNLQQAMAEQAQRNPGPVPEPAPPQSMDPSAFGNQFVSGPPMPDAPHLPPAEVVEQREKASEAIQVEAVAEIAAPKPPIRVAFFQGPVQNKWRQLAHKIICAIDGGKYSHCEVIDAEGYCWGSSYIDGGVRRKLVNFNNERWKVLELEGDLEKVVAWFELHEGEKYDMFGLLGFVLPWRVSDRSRWFCSEAIAEALGIPLSWKVGLKELASFAKE